MSLQPAMAYPVLFDEKGTLSKLYGVRGVPTLIIADKNGKIVFKNFAAPQFTEEKFRQLNQ